MNEAKGDFTMLLCPFCDCTFVCQEDLDVHLKVFGEGKRVHLSNWKRELDRRLNVGSGWQERVVWELERLILRGV